MSLIHSAILGVALASSLIGGAEARDHNRNPEVPKQFQHQHPCPSTGSTTGACPGYVRDHIVPLCKGGSDSAGNMQWQTTQEGKTKDRSECR